MQDDCTPIVIAVAPNGARKQRADHPRLPLSPDELAQCAADCLAAGASMMHLHVRDPAGRHSLEPADYRAAIAAIRERVGDALILQLTSEAGGRYAPAEQAACLEAFPAEAVSLAIRELFATPADVARTASLVAELAARATMIQYIVYSPGDVARCVELHGAGVLPDTAPNILFVLGSYAEKRAGRPAELLPMLATLPAGWPWSVCAFGPDEVRCMAAGALLGGHVRVGFENNMTMPTGTAAPDNAALVRATAEALVPLRMRPATCAEARRFFRQGCV
jgi:3-keto-5-aminohexanoate cleavage enzyme